MPHEEQFAETVTKFDEPDKFYQYLGYESGEFLSVNEDSKLSSSCVGNDDLVWEQLDEGSRFRHVVSGVVVDSTEVGRDVVTLNYRGSSIGENGQLANEPVTFAVGRGPAELPSAYLNHFKEHGWVCLTSILPPHVVDGLEYVSSTGSYEGKKLDGWHNPIAKHVAVGQAAAEPVSLWCTREYMNNNRIRFGHAPSLALLSKDDGERDVQGWHSDFPYLWGITRTASRGNIPEHEAHGLVLGIQRNICISPFTKVGGATAFKLGSSKEHRGPPEEWGTGATYGQKGYRKENGLPYNGPDADIVEAPAGSIILYDARTWHRAGVNRTDKLRGAMLQAIIPHFVMPFGDTTRPYREYLQSPVVKELNMREFYEIESLMLNRISGIGGEQVITVDREMTKEIQPDFQNSSAY